jgi:hypothetical protein
MLRLKQLTEQDASEHNNASPQPLGWFSVILLGCFSDLRQ